MSDGLGCENPPARSGRSARSGTTSARGALAVTALLVVPIALVPVPGEELTVVSLWGLLTVGPTVSPGGVHIYPIWSYFLDQPRPFGTLPASIRLWPVATGFHLLAATSAACGAVFGREDRRVTGWLLVLAALATLTVTVGLADRLAGGLFVDGGVGGLPVVLPLATLASLVVVTAEYRRDLRRLVG